MPRHLDTAALDGAAREYAHQWTGRDVMGRSGKRFVAGPSWVLQDFYAFDFRDEFDYVFERFMEHLAAPERAKFEAAWKKKAEPREDAVYERLLAEKLALAPSGDHREGCIGRVQVGVRPVGMKPFEVEKIWSIRRRKELGLPLHVPRDDRVTEWRVRMDTWPIYAGEGDERIRPGGGVADPLPEGCPPLPLGANVTNISAESAIAGLDAIVDKLDEGSTAATIRWRTGAQPADPDAAESGTLLGTNTCSDPAVAGAVDDGDGTVSATFAAITDDSAADATGTVGYMRAGATGTGADDHIDGNSATSNAAYVVNTTSVVSGATLSITSAVAGLDQGSTAT